jgi:hypothetical protein
MKRLYMRTVRGEMLGLNATHYGGEETPDSLHHISMTVCEANSECGKPVSEEIVLTLSLTVPQMAQIAWYFFRRACEMGVFEVLLRKLMKNRWDVMTSPGFKNPRNRKLDPEAWDSMQYYRRPRG